MKFAEFLRFFNIFLTVFPHRIGRKHPQPFLFATFAVSEPSAITIKKPPNSFLSKSLSILVAKNEQTIHDITAGKSRDNKLFFLTSPFFICTQSATEPDGKNATRLANCAVSCPTPSPITKIGKVSVHPPIPIPAKIPPATPAKTKYINCIITSLFAKSICLSI